MNIGFSELANNFEFDRRDCKCNVTFEREHFHLVHLFSYSRSMGPLWFRILELARVGDHDFLPLEGFVPPVNSDVFHQVNNFLSFHNLTKNDMLAVEMGRQGGGNEELRAIGVGAGVGHGEEIFLIVADEELGVPVKALVLEFLAVDGFPSSPVMISKVTSLAHESPDDAVETGPFIAKALFTGA